MVVSVDFFLISSFNILFHLILLSNLVLILLIVTFFIFSNFIPRHFILCVFLSNLVLVLLIVIFFYLFLDLFYFAI
jgi:hypothetical protein